MAEQSASVRAAEVAIAWADAEGWNPGLDDRQRFLAADPESFLATEHDGEVAGPVSCALYGEDYAFIGFYIVRSDLRRRGIGSTLFDRALARAIEPSSETVRMYLNGRPPEDVEKVFGVTTFEFG